MDTTKTSKLKQWRYIGLTVLIAVVLLLFFGRYYFFNDNQQNDNNAQLVVPAIARTADVAVYLSALGNVTPTYSVTVKTQINGQLLQLFFNEGQLVKAGDLLAQIDSRPYQALLMQYQGNLQRDTALLANARLNLKRYQTLWAQNSISKKELDTQEALVKQYEGTVQNDEGFIQETQLKLEYCQIKAPVDGRIGLHLVDAGNYVQISDEKGLAVINTVNPITVIFSIPEDDIPQVMQQINADKPLLVKAYDRNQSTLLAEGTLLAVDNQINSGTGTVKLKAQFANEDNKLFPSQFVNIRLLVNVLHDAVVIPTAAIQYGSKGSFVFLLSDDKKSVRIQPVKVGVVTGDNTAVTGITAGQSVVVEGADKLIDGARIKV